jgi:hypothetical protein
MISNEILDMQENQIIAQLKVKWWNEQRVSGEVCTAKKKSKTASLSIKNVGGVFVVFMQLIFSCVFFVDHFICPFVLFLFHCVVKRKARLPPSLLKMLEVYLLC